MGCAQSKRSGSNSGGGGGDRDGGAGVVVARERSFGDVVQEQQANNRNRRPSFGDTATAAFTSSTSLPRRGNQQEDLQPHRPASALLGRSPPSEHRSENLEAEQPAPAGDWLVGENMAENGGGGGGGGGGGRDIRSGKMAVAVNLAAPLTASVYHGTSLFSLATFDPPGGANPKR
ncbi:unnamed protein product [Pylaiella littoralis]